MYKFIYFISNIFTIILKYFKFIIYNFQNVEYKSIYFSTKYQKYNFMLNYGFLLIFQKSLNHIILLNF